ncbi:nuclear transport factor 2 family protein [Pyruvatibacter sp.]|uniref:nuclear transport factor 2 family protein n=1 Tax=Pyruvatibacter sp. TaxID=1981328 RepID=UPI0032F03379
MSDRASLLFANDAFYRAFADRDIQAMAQLWAHDDTILCLHPGWAPLRGFEEVMSSFQGIFEGPAPPAIQPEAADAALHGDIGIVICYEHIGQDYLIATNIFRHDGTSWRLIHHQAGPANEPPAGQDDKKPDAIN